jgi:glycosyltransferase involved in cell wall biosynthesis
VPLKILMLHNLYSLQGGEDVSARSEAKLLQDFGHSVDLVLYDNKAEKNLHSIKMAARAVWSFASAKDVQDRLSTGGYDLMHVQNYFPLISPAVLRVASNLRVPTVQALRNYRLICANGQLFRENHACFKCHGAFAPWHGIVHGCYRGSRAGSAAVTAMIAFHKLIGTWHSHTTAFIAVSEHVRDVYVSAGFPADRIFAKPNVVTGSSTIDQTVENQLAYVGRLSPEKGIESLFEAWRKANRPGRLVIAGDGPSESALRSIAEGDDTIHFMGRITPDEAKTVMARSKAIVIPSLWGEPFPRTGVEAFSVGTPVFGAASGGIVELIVNERAGALYPAGHVDALSHLIGRLFSDQRWAVRLRGDARAVFAERYAPQVVVKRTEEIYRWAMAQVPIGAPSVP